MNTKNKLILTSTVAALSLGWPMDLTAQNAEGSARVGDTEVQGSVQTDRTGRTDLDRNLTGNLSAAQPTVTAVTKVNKASSLMGMDVRNNQNEKLGDIKDLAVDLQSGKIAYAVLSVGGFLGIGEKLLAVPPSAFTVGPDQNTLVLNADKEKIQNAPGFARAGWPDLNSPSWQTESAYWLQDNVGQGTGGSIRSGTGGDNASGVTTRPLPTDDTTTDRPDRTQRNDAQDDR